MPKQKCTEPSLDGNQDIFDWEKLMIISDDSLFDEMTKQMDGRENNTLTVSPLASLESEKEHAVADDKLLDLNQKNKDAVTGLLMLGAAVNLSMDATVDCAIDEDIDNEAILPVNAPKKLDFIKEMKDEENNKNKGNKRDSVANKPGTSKQKQIPPEVESSSTDTPKSPSGKLVITRQRLKKTPIKIVEWKKVCCTVCRKAFEDKDMLRDHNKREFMHGV